jgi:two-component system, OmpR family, sensor histidine kinase KdpD
MMTRKHFRGVIGRVTAGTAVSLLMTLVAFRLHFNLSAATSVQLFLVTVIAMRWGFLEAGVASLAAVVCLDYFFTEPLFTFYIADRQDWVALLAFEGVALVVSSLSNRLSRHARESELHRAQMQKLYELSQSILLLDQDKAVEQQLTKLLHSTLRVKGVMLWNAYDLRMCRSGECSLTDDQARSIYSMDTDEDSSEKYTSRRALHQGKKPIGSLVIGGHSLDAATIDAIASLTSLAIERAASFATATSAEAARQSEQLRSAVLDGLAHAFKSPLTTIRSSSSGLLAMDTLAGTEKRLVMLIDQHASKLADLTTHLLKTARLDSGELRLRREAIDITRLIEGSVETSSLELGEHAIHVRTAACHSLVWADKQLLQMAFFQLLDNAAKYSKPGSSIVVDVQESPAEMVISVQNEGSFIPPEEREKVFQRFYRGPGSEHRVAGTGLGLSVVRRITEAHRGRTWVVSDPEEGTTFVLTLPRTEKGK